MGVKKFKADVSATAKRVATGNLVGVTTISEVSDNEFALIYGHKSLSKHFRIQVVAQNAHEYPDDNTFMLWAADENAPQLAIDTLQAMQDYLVGLSVYELAMELSKQLGKAFNEDADVINDDYSGDEGEDEDEDDSFYALDDDAFGLESERPQHGIRSTAKEVEESCHRIREDLRWVREAGYKIGSLDGLGRDNDQGIVSISIRVRKLALSDEALEAWDIEESDYLVLLIRFEERYEPLNRIISKPASHSKIAFRIGKCKKHKPSLQQALYAFSESNTLRKGTQSPPEEALGESDTSNDSDEFHKLFISASLNQYMNESLISLVKIRETTAFSWEAANEELIKKTGLGLVDSRGMPEYSEDPMEVDQPPEENHRILACDHLTDNNLAEGRSFPLIAMQFAIRYFVKCTEYCLRCHRKLEKGFEALRPYVCSEPLCLFQYMNMGFGPSIEHEIMTQPYVVDLLVSLCYVAVQASPYGVAAASADISNPGHTNLPIRNLPVGLRLQVPDFSQAVANPHRARWSDSGIQLVFDVDKTLDLDPRLTENTWIAFRVPGQSLIHHAVVIGVNAVNRSILFEERAQSAYDWGTGAYAKPVTTGNTPSTSLSTPGAEGNDGLQSLETVPFITGDHTVDVFFYDTDFDMLSDGQKGDAMRHILDTLPSILEVEAFLNSHPHSLIRSMRQVSSAAASLLQWIVSSNRSCIFQIDHTREVFQDSGPTKQVKVGRGRDREHERIPGINGWVQFRFAQGSPDKELRFKRALKEVAARKSIQSNPTIFAWHGSNLFNWHSIVRTGLDFKDIRNARAFGNGVYFSPNFATSLGYVGSQPSTWPNSDLKVGSCISLNEIVNAPDEFVSTNPHYVVNQLDWHQCRYLFVRSEATTALMKATSTSTHNPMQGKSKGKFHKQSSITGPDGKALTIPLSAIPFRHVGAEPTKQAQPSKRNIWRLKDDSSDEEVEFLFQDGNTGHSESPPKKRLPTENPNKESQPARDSYVLTRLMNNLKLTKGHRSGGTRPPSPPITERGLTDFEPGKLNWSMLPRLAEPSFSNTIATQALARELKKLQEVQAKTPLHELGWWMDFERVDNIYQWIVELHSFDPALPLAQDMKKVDMTSIVLEIRFPKDYPMAPPFVRVVRPRFLPFIQGGGGHVTGGGAMCMELLTNTGWSPANSMESVIIQVRMAMCNLEPRPGRIHSVVTPGHGSSDYGVAEAVEAYVRAANTHGWKVPPDLQTTAHGGI